MEEKENKTKAEQSVYSRKKRVKHIKRNITRSQFHFLLEKASQPINPKTSE
jgi:hypothetical protein